MTTPTAVGNSNALGDSDMNSKSKSARPLPLLRPVPRNDTPLATIVSLGRVAALLGLLAWYMDRLIQDPTSALWTSLPVVAAIQTSYLIICVPPAGSSSSSSSPNKTGKKRRSEGGRKSISNAIVALILTTLTIPVIHVLLILFGAPFLVMQARTALCAAHLALVGLLPVVHARGLDRASLVAVVGATAPLDETYGGLAGAVVGAWLGAVPIPLDWDRDWQAWPITIVVGLYLGGAAGSLLAGSPLLYGKRLGKPESVKAD